MNFETKELNVMPEITVAITPTLGELGLKGQGSIAAPEVSPEELAEQSEIIKACMVAVGPEAIAHCIDGRGCKECLDGAPTQPGPSLAGGPLTSAYAAAELTGWFGENDSRGAADKLQGLYNVLTVGGIKIGNHVDRKAINADFAGGATGCGANDKAPLIVAKPFEMKDTVNAGTSILLGEAYDEKAMKFIDQQAVAVAYENWQPTTVLNLLRKANERSLEILEEAHEELFVVFNYVRGTTFDRDAYLARTGRQAFGVDMWYLEDIAAAMMTGPSEVTQKQLHHALTAYQVATYLTLCDGSQRAALVTAV